LPPDLAPTAIGVAAAALGLSLDERQLQQLAAYAQLLQRWNRVHNLTSVRAGEKVLTHHLLDSLAVLPHFLHVGDVASPRVLDVGSGGGLPGVVLAIAAPQAQLTLVDAVQKKCAFLTQAAVELQLRNVDVIHGRVESLHLPPFDVIISRALATLGQFVAWTRHLLKPEGRWLAMKGRLPDDEIAALPTDIRGTAVELRVPGLDEQRHLIVMRTI
jgi:16S rRNA (guanine527-N7)-methyltransferase